MAAFFYNSTGSATAPYDTWAKAATSLATVAAAMAVGDTLWVGDNSNESIASAITATFPGTSASPNFIYCVDHTIASPGTSDLKTGVAGAGSVTTTGNSAITINGCFYCYGVYFSAGDGANSVSLNLGNSNNNTQTFDNCKFVIGGTSGGNINTSVSIATTYWNNCTVKFAAAGSLMSYGNGVFVWTNSLSAIDVAGTIPTTLFNIGSGSCFYEGVDFSALSGKTLFATASGFNTQLRTIKDCKLPSSITIASVTAVYGFTRIDIIRCDSGATNYRTERYTGSGTQTTDIATVRTGGASDGTTSFSWKIATKTIARWTMPFVALPIAIWNSSTGSVSATVEGIADPRDFSALPNNDEVWFTVEYLGSSSTPQGSYTAGTKANNLATGSALSASTQAWDSAATAWATSTAYTVGTIRKVSTNAGRLFLVTSISGSGTSGTDNTIFSSAVDGGTVTDNSGANQVVWKAMWRFKQTVTLSPNPGMAGPLTIYTNVGKASLNGVYIDPLITLS